MNMTQISACYTSLTIKQTTSAVRTSGDKTFNLLLSIGQKEKATRSEQPEAVEIAAATKQKTVSEDSLFAKWANLTPTDERFANEDGTYSVVSRFMAMMEDYEQWKSEQPDATLPQPLGSEEANYAWLRERFPGELDAFGVIDAIESMRSMGLLSREQRNSIYSIEFTFVRMTEVVSPMQIQPAGYKPQWLDSFESAPFINFHSLQDIVDWLKGYFAHPASGMRIEHYEFSAKQLEVIYDWLDNELAEETAVESAVSV